MTQSQLESFADLLRGKRSEIHQVIALSEKQLKAIDATLSNLTVLGTTDIQDPADDAPPLPAFDAAMTLAEKATHILNRENQPLTSVELVERLRRAKTKTTTSSLGTALRAADSIKPLRSVKRADLGLTGVEARGPKIILWGLADWPASKPRLNDEA